MTQHSTISRLALVLTAAGLVALAGCGGPAPAPDTAATTPATDTGPTEAERAAELQAKEQELAARESDLAQKELERKEQDLARQQAELDAQRAAVAKQAAAARAAASKPAATPVAKPASPTPPAKPVPARVTIPAGTSITMALASGLTTKTARVGDSFGALVVQDVAVGSKVAIPAGSRVTGTVSSVISGSDRIGGVPTLGLRFNTLDLPDGQQVALNGELVQQGKSDTGRDTAKILGGAAAGAVIGHQVDHSDKGKVIGGLLGGAAGAIAAKKTGTEVELPQDTTLVIATSTPIEVTAH